MEANSSVGTRASGVVALGGGALQLALAYLGPLVFTVVLSGLLNAPDSVTWQILDYVIFCLFGLAAALAIFGFMPAAAEAGRWIWTVPTALLVFGIVWDMFSGRFDTTLLALFGTGEGGWIKLFVTLPAWSCCWYSATMAWRRRRRNSSLAETAGAV